MYEIGVGAPNKRLREREKGMNLGKALLVGLVAGLIPVISAPALAETTGSEFVKSSETVSV